MTIEEWAKDFKSYVNELDMPRDDYNGIMEYIDDAIAILKDQKTEAEIEGGGSVWWFVCGECRGTIDPYDKFCKHCGRLVKLNA